MSDLVGNPEDRFSRVAAHIILVTSNYCTHDNVDSLSAKLNIDNSPGLLWAV